jgi:hypothetical protein
LLLGVPDSSSPIPPEKHPKTCRKILILGCPFSFSIQEVEGVPKANAMVRHLIDAQESTARTARSLFTAVNAANDQPTADLLTQRLEVHEKTAWMLRSLLED